MLFPRGNLKVCLGGKHQRITTVLSRMLILKRTFYSPLYTHQNFFLFFDSLHRHVDLYSKTQIKCNELLIIITHSEFLHFHNRENPKLNIGKESRP